MSRLRKLETDVQIKAPATLFHAIMSGRQHHISNASPDRIKGCDLHEGERGKPGSVICWTYNHDGISQTSKQIIEDIDDENNSTTYKIIEGDLLEKYKNFHYIVQATPKGVGSLVHWTYIFEKASEGVPEPNGVLQLAIEVTKDIDAHLTKKA